MEDSTLRSKGGPQIGYYDKEGTLGQIEQRFEHQDRKTDDV